MAHEKGFTRRHEGRDDLAGEHAVTDGGQIALLVVFLAVWVCDVFWLKYTTFVVRYARWYVRAPFVVVVLYAAWHLARNGLNILFGEVRETPAVIRKGVFGIVRHPIYLGSILLYLGFLLCFPSLAAAAVWLVIILFYWFAARYEEKLLLEKFGSEYEQYMRDVPMLVPRIRKLRAKDPPPQ